MIEIFIGEIHSWSADSNDDTNDDCDDGALEVNSDDGVIEVVFGNNDNDCKWTSSDDADDDGDRERSNNDDDNDGIVVAVMDAVAVDDNDGVTCDWNRLVSA